MAVRSGLERQLPGRLVGVSVDADGAPAYRLSLQTREQHIRREKATSNICTAQALLAVVAAMYAVYHGPEGLRRIAEQVHAAAVRLRDGLAELGVEVLHDAFFDTVVARVPGAADAVLAAAVERGINLRRIDADHVGLTTDETTTVADVSRALVAVPVGTGRGEPPTREIGWTGLWGADGLISSVGTVPPELRDLDPRTLPRATEPPRAAGPTRVPESLRRTTPYLTHPTFHRYRSETALMRYLRTLADKDLALDRTMIPLGSCTMKLNAAVELETISWPEFAEPAPVRPGRPGRGLPRAHRRARGAPRRDHRLRRGEPAAQRGLPGRAVRPAGDPRLPPLARRGRARRVPHPRVGARHQRGVGGAGRHARGGRGDRAGRHDRRRRPGRQARRARRPGRGDHDHLPVDARRVRGGRARRVRRGARRGRPGVHRRGEPQRAGRAGPARRVRRRRLAPQPAQDVRHPARRRRPRRRPGRRRRPPGGVPPRRPRRPVATGERRLGGGPEQPSDAPHEVRGGARASVRSRRRGTAAPACCRSPTPTCC